MGFLVRFKLLRRKEEHLATDLKVVVDVRHQEKEDMVSSVLQWTPRTDPAAERELPELLWDAAHSPEVLDIKASFLRDPTLNVLSRALSAASSITVASSSTSSPATSSLTRIKRAPKRLHLYDFKQIRGIGGGGCGSVYLVKHIPTGKELAMKVIDKRYTREDQALQEQAVLKDIGTRGINGIMDFVGSFHNPRHFFLLTTFYSGGDLDGLIRRWGRLPMSLVKFYAAELLCAINSLHDMGYVHRDLKPENVLLSETGHIILADFGFTKSVASPGQIYMTGSYEHEFLHTACGTVAYMSPEQWLRKPYAFTTDAWSFGIIIFKMIVGRTPWTATFKDSADVIMQHLLAPFDEWLGNDHLDPQSRSFLEGMLAYDPFYRATLKESMGHSWWGNIDWKAIASGYVPVPDVGSPPTRLARHGAEDVFVGSFGGGGVYIGSDDPHAEFNYASPILAAEGYDDDSFDENASIPPHDSFDNISLEDPERDDGLEGDGSSPPAVIEMAPLPMLFGMACVTTTVTVTTEDEVEPTPGVSIVTAVAVREKPIGIFACLNCWLGDVVSAIAHLCSRLPFL